MASRRAAVSARSFDPSPARLYPHASIDFTFPASPAQTQNIQFRHEAFPMSLQYLQCIDVGVRRRRRLA